MIRSISLGSILSSCEVESLVAQGLEERPWLLLVVFGQGILETSGQDCYLVIPIGI